MGHPNQQLDCVHHGCTTSAQSTALASFAIPSTTLAATATFTSTAIAATATLAATAIAATATLAAAAIAAASLAAAIDTTVHSTPIFAAAVAASPPAHPALSSSPNTYGLQTRLPQMEQLW